MKLRTPGRSPGYTPNIANRSSGYKPGAAGGDNKSALARVPNIAN